MSNIVPSLRGGIKGRGEGKGARQEKKEEGGLGRGKGRKHLPQGPHILLSTHIHV